ncbi:hypothetical protein ACEU6E_06255 [Halorutilales archaeon Cl-col2-1]
MTDDPDEIDVDELREKTRKSDRIDEGAEDDDEDGDSEDLGEIEYAGLDEVLVRDIDSIEELREHTVRKDRIEKSDDGDEVELVSFDETGLEGEAYDSVGQHYCGNCAHVDFRKRHGETQVYCEKHEAETRVEKEMVCPDYVPQGFLETDS